jgi:hypothetical protein
MTKGYLATLFAAAVSFAGTQAAFAAAPVITPFPDVQIGDMEDNVGSDNNFFVFTNAFQFSTHVSDADSTAGQMLWSFAEYYDAGAPYADTVQEFQINGKNPIAVGASAIATETSNSYPNAKAPGANKLNASSDYATFRDILFSPLAGSPPFASGIGALTPTQKTYSANVGKNVVLYVADDTQNLAQDVIKVKTKDQDFDKVSTSFTVLFDQGNGNAMSGWIESGLNSVAADVTNQPGGGTAFDDVDRTDQTGTTLNPATPSTTQTDLGTIVRASSHRYRILGWTNPNGIAYPGAGSYVRGKFYVYTNNGAADAQNKYPPFRARVQQGGAIIGWLNMSYVGTGNTGGNTGDGSVDYALFNDPTAETYGAFLRPSRNSAKPSLYRVDLDPVDVPAAVSMPIVPTFESFAFQDPTAGTIFLAQCTLGTYPALDDTAGTQVFNYNRSTTAAAQGLAFQTGGFLVENNFTFGYRQHLFLPPAAGQSVHSENVGTTGLVDDTGAGNAVYSNRFVVGTDDVVYTSNASRPRIQANKLYRARFYATSDVPTSAASTSTERQGTIRFRMQTGGGVESNYIELPGGNVTAFNTSSGNPSADSNYRNAVISAQALPGVNCVNPETDNTLSPGGAYDGGWYTVLMSSPLNLDIRRDVGGTIASAFGVLASDPGPGSASASVGRDIKTGFDVYTAPLNMVMSGATVPWTDANRAKVAVTAIKVFELDDIDDGAYPY